MSIGRRRLMENEIIEKLDYTKDQVEEAWIQALSIRDSLRVFECSLDNVIHDKHKDICGIMHIYIILSEVLADRMEQILHDLENVLEECKRTAAF